MDHAASLRSDARGILRAGVRGADPQRLVAAALSLGRTKLTTRGRTLLCAVGKAAPAMARGALAALAAQGVVPDDGLVVVPPGLAVGGGLGDLPVLRAGHPTPTAGSVAAAGRALALAEAAGAGDLLLVLLSGGASALLSAPPPGVGLDDVASLTTGLQRAGATIAELNCVRRHLSRVKGGLLAACAAPAAVSALLLSDVIGDRPEVIGSGPCSPDPSSYDDALEVLRRHGLADGGLPAAVVEHLRAGSAGERAETPRPGDERLRRAEVRVIGSNADALLAAAEEAAARGYRPFTLTRTLSGSARAAGARLAALARALRTDDSSVGSRLCVLAGGETTVKVRGDGRGGRNQELALAAALELEGSSGALLAAAGTDGVDGPTDAAGALADGRTVARGAALGLSAAEHLARNDAYSFFGPLHDLLLWGPTGTNVMDLNLLLVVGQRERSASRASGRERPTLLRL